MSWRSRYRPAHRHALTRSASPRPRGVSLRDDDATKEKVTLETVRNTYDIYVSLICDAIRPNASIVRLDLANQVPGRSLRE